MELIPIFSNELEQEAETTREFLSLVPEDKFDWKPHEKSMSMKELTIHIAEIPSWTMRNGDQVLMVMPKHAVIRHALNQITHHQA